MLQCQATEDAGALQCALHEHEGDKHSWTETVTTWEAALRRATAICDEIAIKRHRKYGPENIKATGETGLWVRMSDKLARISRAMTTGEFEFPDDKFEDAIIDLVNYGRFWLMWRAHQWELPALVLDEEPLAEPPSESDRRWASKTPARGVDACPSCGATTRGTKFTVCKDAWHLGSA